MEGMEGKGTNCLTDIFFSLAVRICRMMINACIQPFRLMLVISLFLTEIYPHNDIIGPRLNKQGARFISDEFRPTPS